MSRYCPAGDGSFDDWVERCPECGRPLVDDKVTEVDLAGSSTITWLTSAPNEPEAQMWANALRSNGIQVFLRAGGPGVGAWASVSSFEHDLLVRESDLFRARRIVKELLVGEVASSGRMRSRRAAPIRNPIRVRSSRG